MDTVQAVERGAELLDRVEPGWAEVIDVYAFSMDDPDACILGQVYRDRSLSGADYCYGLDALSNEVEDHERANLASNYGFDHHPYDSMQRLWLQQIAIRV